MVAPDFGMFLVSAICLGLCNRLTRRPKCPTPRERLSRSSELLEQQEEEEHQAVVTEDEVPEGKKDNEEIQMSLQDGVLASRLREAAHKLLEAVWKSLALLLLALAGITVPSGFSAVYYLAFVGLCTWWACHLPISHVGLNTLSVMVGFFTGGHIICLYGYQSPFIQNFFPPPELWARLFGLKDIIIHTNCTGSVDELLLNQNHDWPVYVNPGILLLLYYAVISVLKLKTPSTERKGDGVETKAADPQKSAQEDLEMAEVESWRKERYSVGEETKPMLPPQTSEAAEIDLQDCTVHVIQPESRHNPADRKPDASKEQSPLLFLGNVILNQSYICALIAMMVWSITYHSWLTFVLLLWACLIWMVRSRRQFAMLCSPFILLYALTLCSLQYVWSMDLEKELPKQLGFMRLSQLGLARAPYPCLNLGALLLFTLTFWLLLHQFVTEQLLKRRRVTAALVEVTVPESGQPTERNLLKCFGAQVMSFYAKYWIYVCGGMFIMVSFAGRLVVYKNCLHVPLPSLPDHLPGQSVRKIGKTLKVSPSAVAKTIKSYKETGSHEDRPRKGRPRVTSASEDKFIRVTSLRNRRLTAAQIRDQVNATQSSSSRHISTTTVKRRLCAAGLHGKIAARKPLLRTGNKQERLVWAKEHKEWTLDQWKSVLWSDESKFEIFGSNHRVFVRRRKGGRMDSTCLVPTVKHGGGGVMDNDPKHTSRLCKGYLTKKESDGVLRQMTWPPQSPDLDPIKMVWGELDRE
ncbi:unnamed protein product [Ranitomeya imitator]|uniref:Transposase Tc1-like domain-containing protein n=1 Tax=Ranitomeya imitator TaxID=111125 RepID=A0ABN9M4L0_9NEOB|nr:unnamed protein product [Ranitomeya imitator]